MKRLIALLLFAAPLFAQQTRIASDFEIAQMEKLAATGDDFVSQLTAYLNLGDLRVTRNESALARQAYTQALIIAESERAFSQRKNDLRRYATATFYAGFANAKLRRPREAIELLEDAVRYASDEQRKWNLYAIAMNELRLPEKAIGAARHAVAIAEQEARKSPTVANTLDLTTAQATLAHSLSVAGRDAEAIPLLERAVSTLRSKTFDKLRREAARREEFQVYSTANSDVSAYVSLTNRAGLMLATAYEKTGDVANARKAYRVVLDARSDDPMALAGIARLSTASGDVARAFGEAFDANPFSVDLIRDYESWLRGGGHDDAEGTTPGARMRLALNQMQRRENTAAHATLESLLATFPKNDTIRALIERLDAAAHATQLPSFVTNGATTATPTEADLRALIAVTSRNQLTSDQRSALDRLVLTNVVRFDAGPSAPEQQTIFEVAHLGETALKFAEPTAFNGTFSAATPLRLTYRILGATELGGGQALLVEPLKLEAAQ